MSSIKKVLAIALVIAAAGALVPAKAAADRDIQRQSFPLPAGRAVHIDFPVGELDVLGGGGDQVEVRLSTRCDRDKDESRCEREARNVRVESDVSASRLDLRVTGYAKWNNHGLSVHGTIRVPRGSEVFIDMGVGRLGVEDVGGDLTAELGVGELEIIASEEVFDSALLDAGIGETTLRTADGRRSGRRSFLIGSEVEWREGKGRSALRAHVGVGEITVRLE